MIANRIWHYCLGEGLVSTPDDFGVTGATPTHPALLDYLASSFVVDGWSVKRLVRRVVLSKTFCRSSAASAEQRALDPENRLLARARVRHLDAEALRDALLAISRQLDSTTGGPTIRKLAAHDYNYRYDSLRRSVYVPRFRSEPLPAFTTFDCANSNMVTGRRQQTVLATQALFMLNSPLVIGASEHVARSLNLETTPTDRATIRQHVDTLFVNILGRSATDDERRLTIDYLENALDAVDTNELVAYSGVCQLLFSSVDFRFLR